MQERRNFRFTKNAADLGGSERFSSDGLISHYECRKLIYIANNFMNINDGYKENILGEKSTSPHTKNERFGGIDLSRISFLVYIGLLKPAYLRLLLDVTEDMRIKLVNKFNIEESLYFSYTHLVCRSALEGISGNRTDLSHKIHADNCNLLDDNNCAKKYPAFYWRDYSAILYLNDDFHGGHFIFSSDSKGQKIQSSIIPKCGRMVGFSSGSENLHGVTGVTKGRRCALAVWFTLDPTHQELDRDVSEHMLDNDITFHQYYSRVADIP